MLSSGDLDLRSGTRDFLFLLEAGLRDLGAGVRSLGSGVAGFGFPHPGSIYTYSRSTAPAAVMLLCPGSCWEVVVGKMFLRSCYDFVEKLLKE